MDPNTEQIQIQNLPPGYIGFKVFAYDRVQDAQQNFIKNLSDFEFGKARQRRLTDSINNMTAAVNWSNSMLNYIEVINITETEIGMHKQPGSWNTVKVIYRRRPH
ncbi:serine/threonine-protein kinase [Acrasis kona]|uniref:Serine/threonine-protein kinase n=1 Tax=Acrasis kona TaxID=1008807 RepID=A0AAW2ZK30_9EUKA